MIIDDPLENSYEQRLKSKIRALRWRNIHLDPFLLILLLVHASFGLFILYSASNNNFLTVEKQAMRLILGFALLFIFAQIPPQRYYQWSPIIYTISFLLLIAVLFVGNVQNGARRWFNLYLLNFQPSEIMKLALPMMLAWYFSEKDLPPKAFSLLISILLLVLPILLIVKQPDLSTALLITASGLCLLLLSGISWKLILSLLVTLGSCVPFVWHHLHDYQQQRVFTFLDPERDPLGKGYHIIQSKIAIGSGGILGKGWLNGTQSHLSFLPEHTTDFIFAVGAEELGLIGGLWMLILFLAILGRCLYISLHAQDTYTRLLGGSISLTFILFAYLNIGMVIGILPVAGVPLPLISYGGSSLLTFMAGFGIIMSIHTHRKLWGA